LQHCRGKRNRHDRIVSIEMIEAVGEHFQPNYFSRLRDKGRLAGIQAITIQDSLFQTCRREFDFIQRYACPGGMLPSPQILKALGERFSVSVIRERISGREYAKTFAIWRSNFRAARPRLMPSGFDDRSAGCGNAIPLTAKPDSCRETSTCVRWCSPNPADLLPRAAGLYGLRRSFRVARRSGSEPAISRHDHLQQRH
jgi:hypothetical protein